MSGYCIVAQIGLDVGDKFSYQLAYARIEESNQPAHPRSLIRVFDGSMGSQWFKVSSGGKIRL